VAFGLARKVKICGGFWLLSFVLFKIPEWRTLLTFASDRPAICGFLSYTEPLSAGFYFIAPWDRTSFLEILS